MKKTYFLSLILYLAVLVMAMMMTGCVACFFDIPSLVMVLLSTIILLLANYSPGEMGKYFRLCWTRDRVDSFELKNGIVFFKAFQKYLVLSGVIGFFMGMIGMLATLDDPARIGRGLSLALVTVLYSIFFSMVIAVPFRTGLEKKLNEPG